MNRFRWEGEKNTSSECHVHGVIMKLKPDQNPASSSSTSVALNQISATRGHESKRCL